MGSLFRQERKQAATSVLPRHAAGDDVVDTPLDTVHRMFLTDVVHSRYSSQNVLG